jgi:hypothetical protein
VPPPQRTSPDYSVTVDEERVIRDK